MNNEPIEDASDAVTFYRDCFLHMHLNVNPDEGFVCAEGRSLFQNLSDEDARIAHERNEEAVAVLMREGVDAWEVAQHMSMLVTYADHAMKMRVKGVSPHIFTTEMLMVLAPKIMSFMDGTGHVRARRHRAIHEESAEFRMRRRSEFVLAEISWLCEGALGASVSTFGPEATERAIAIPSEVLPPLWSVMLDRHALRAGGVTHDLEATEDTIEEVIQQKIDEHDAAQNADLDLDSDENDDDPFGWDAQ